MLAASATPELPLDDLPMLQALGRAASLAEAFRVLLGGIERTTGLPAVLARIGAVRPAILATGPLAAAGDEIPFAGPWNPHPVYPGLAQVGQGQGSWLAATLPGIGEVHLLIGWHEEADATPLPARLALWLEHQEARLGPMLESLHLLCLAEYRQQAMDDMLTLSERHLHEGEPLTLQHLTDFALALGLPSVALWQRAAEGGWVLGAAAGAPAIGQSWSLPVPEGAIAGPWRDLHSGETIVPLIGQGQVRALMVLGFPTEWLEEQQATAVGCLAELARKRWVLDLMQAAVAGKAASAGREPIDGELQAFAQTAAHMTHEVRNKLNVVATGAYLLKLKASPLLEEHLQQLFVQMEENIQASSKMMNELVLACKRWR